MIPLINTHEQSVLHPHHEIHNSIEIEFLSGRFERGQIIGERSSVPGADGAFYRLWTAILGQEMLRKGAFIQLQTWKGFNYLSSEVRVSRAPDLEVLFEALLASTNETKGIVCVRCIGCVYVCPDVRICLRPCVRPPLPDRTGLSNRYYGRKRSRR